MNTATISRASEFRERLASRVLVADGAMGTMLYSRGVFINRCFDELNLSSADLVRGIHQEYVKAGAEILETNTFGGTRPRLAAFGVAEKLKEINRAGVRLAREAAKDGPFVAGAVGPLGVRIEPLGPTSFEEARAAFREQIDALLEAGVDLLVFETFGNLDELREAVTAAREAAGSELPLIAQVTIDDFGHLPGGTDTETFTRAMDSWPVDVIGLNCSVGPKATLETIERMMQYSSKPMSAMPNAGAGDRKCTAHGTRSERAAVQTKAVTFFLGCKAVSENASKIFGRNTNPIVCHDDVHALFGGRKNRHRDSLIGLFGFIERVFRVA